MMLTNPHDLTRLLESLAMSPKDKLALNRKLANRTRQFFRGQIRQQRDIDNNPYQSKRKRKIAIVTRGVRGKHGDKHRRHEVARNTVNNRNMLLGLSRSLRTQATTETFAVGLTGVAGQIARVHNEGQTVSFTQRLNGYYNRKTGKWQGGLRVKGNYEMPKRTFIGWTPRLEKELMSMVSEAMLLGENSEIGKVKTR